MYFGNLKKKALGSTHKGLHTDKNINILVLLILVFVNNLIESKCHNHK